MKKIDIKPIIEQFGPPAYENEKRKLAKLNEPFWASCYAASRRKIIYEPNEKQFYDYDSSLGIFVPKSSDLIRTELGALVMEGSKNWDGHGAMEQFRSERHLAGIVSHLRGQVEHRDFFNNQCHLVHLGNCTLKFEPDGTSFSSEEFSPLHRNRARSPINYDRAATCPEFEQKLLSHIKEEDRLLLQKYSGQCILGRNLTQRFVILDGLGGSSKSAFVLTINGVVGARNVYELRTKWLMDRFEIGRMLGRTLLVGSDVKGDFLSTEGADRLKSLTGGDVFKAELKGSNHSFDIYGIFNVLITANTRLRIWLDEDRSAWQRRLLIVRYDKPYSGQRICEIEKYLLEKEGSGILNWCLEGLKMLLQDYAVAGDIILSDEQKKRVSDLLSESDSLRLFVSSQLIRDTTRRPDGTARSLTTEEIITNYIGDCLDQQWIPVGYATAEKRLPDLMIQYFGITKSHDLSRPGKKNQRGYWNVRFS